MKSLAGSRPISGKQILIWFAVLFVVLACLPTSPSPVPTLDPNHVNLLIQQTAEAASIQTLTAYPTFTLTPTTTVTPASTFTPEPTQTPFSIFVLPTLTESLQDQFFRVRHDNQLERYNYESRTASGSWKLGPQTPETVPLFAAAKDGSGTQRTTINAEWEYYMDSLNNFDDERLDYLKADNTALFNHAGFPQMESLTMGGNVVKLDEIRGDWGRVHTMDYNHVGVVTTENYTTRPDLVHKFVVVMWNRRLRVTYWVNPPKGDIYWPLVSAKPVWIPLERLEPFPTLPMQVSAEIEQDIRREPSSKSELTGRKLLVGETVTIVKYFPSGSKVWAMLPDGSWIALFMYQKNGPTYFTSWAMQTSPPLP